MKIIGIEGLSDQDIRQELRMGGRFLQFSYTISLVLVSFQRSSNIYFLRAGQNGFLKGLPFTLTTLGLGWWGIPWGPIYSLHSLMVNAAGGKDVTEHITGTPAGSPSGPPIDPVAAQKKAGLKLVGAILGTMLLMLGGIGAFIFFTTPKPIPITFEQIRTPQMDGKRVLVEGYLDIGSSVMSTKTKYQTLYGIEFKNHPGDQTYIKADVTGGNCSSCMQTLPRNYTEKDFKIRAADGSSIGAGDRVRITAKVRYTTNAGTEVCYITVYKIEKA